MKILSYRRFALWWQLAMDWFQRQFAAIAASIDFTPVEEKLDEVKSDVADVKTAVENIDIDTSDLAKEATLSDFRTSLMGKDGYLTIRPLFGVREASQTGTTINMIGKVYTGGAWSDYGLEGVYESSWESYEMIGYTRPLPDRTYDFRLGCFDGAEILDGMVGQRKYYVPTAAPLNILIQDGQGNVTLNYEGLELLELVKGSRVKCLKEVKYYNHATQGTVKDDDESGIDYASDSDYTYILSVYVYAEDEEYTEITLNDVAKETTLGAPPVGSERTTVFQYLAAILDNIEGQGGEDIPEGLGDRINLLLQFFNLPQSLPEYHAMTEAEVLEIADEEWQAMYGFVAVPNTVHTVDGGGSERVFTTYMNPNKTYADYGWPALWDAQGETIALTDHPTAGRVIYTFNPNND